MGKRKGEGTEAEEKSSEGGREARGASSESPFGPNGLKRYSYVHLKRPQHKV